jgi:hypothetical protein
MSEQSQPLFPRQESVESEAVTVPESSQEKVPSDSPFQGYIDLECETSGIFGIQDIDTAKQILSRIES